MAEFCTPPPEVTTISAECDTDTIINSLSRLPGLSMYLKVLVYAIHVAKGAPTPPLKFLYSLNILILFNIPSYWLYFEIGILS